MSTPRRRIVAATFAACLGLGAAASGTPPGSRHVTCRPVAASHPHYPYWARSRRMTVLVDSVLLSGEQALRSDMPCWHIHLRGRPALMIRIAERELRAAGQRVAPLVVIGLGYNSLWEHHRRRYGFWAHRFDAEAARLLATLRRLGGRVFIWVTLRQPTRAVVPPSGWGELAQYSWYFPYVNERLRRLARARSDLTLADWTRVSRRPGITYDSIHLNPRGARLMAHTIGHAVQREARREAAASRR